MGPKPAAGNRWPLDGGSGIRYDLGPRGRPLVITTAGLGAPQPKEHTTMRGIYQRETEEWLS